MSKIVVGVIQPIQAKGVNFDALLQDRVKRVDVGPAVAELRDLFCPQLVDGGPRVTPDTRQRAYEAADRVIAMMSKMPHTEVSSDILALAFTIKHFQDGGER